jgi:hypothetical protein
MTGSTMSIHENSSLDTVDVSSPNIHNLAPPSAKIHSETAEIETSTSYAATRSPLSLRRFPPEIRHMVFYECVRIQDGKSPILLAALRSDPELYHEALQLFNERNYLTLKWSTVD